MVEVQHQLNCAKLMRRRKDEPVPPCSCGAEKRPVHNHGPEEGQGLACPEWTLVSGERVGTCCLTEHERQSVGLDRFDAPLPVPAVPHGYNQVEGAGAEDPAPRAGTVPPVAPNTARRLLGLPEAGEVRTVSRTGGEKGVKPQRFDLIPAEALTKLAEHYAVGAEKYGDHNWRKGFEYSKSYAALQRHLVAWWGGEDLDPETGKSHLTAVAFHAFTLLTFQAEHPEFDDRFKKGTQSGSE